MTHRFARYTTTNYGLATYLLHKGLIFTGIEAAGNSNQGMFVFEDPKGRASVLEQEYLNSPEKHFRDVSFYLRNALDQFFKYGESKIGAI